MRPPWIKVKARQLKLFWQWITRGWSDKDTWSLSGTVAKFALPRLKRFKELNNGHPVNMTEDSWNAAIDDMIYALEICVKEDDSFVEDADWERVEKGLLEFGHHFRDLWW